MNYEEDMFIDETALDIEWLEQAALALKYGKHWADLQKQVDLADEKIKLIKSQLIKKANLDPDKYLGQGVKPTAPVVEAFYRNNTRHKEAKNEFIELTYEMNVAAIAKSEVSFTRKAALENLVILHGQQYFAGPRVPLDITRRKVNETVINKGISQKLKRNRT